MAQRVIISSDSTCDLSQELIEQYGIRIFALTIVREDEVLRDGIDIKTKDIFDYKRQTNKLIKTSAANMMEYENYFNSIAQDEDCAIVHFCISSDMSVSYTNARNAEPKCKTFVVDSRNLSTGIGLQVLKACELRDAGKSAEEIFESIEAMKEKVDTTFVIDTLEYLHKGGRCSGVARLGANLLKLKPCILVENGKMDVGKKYKGKLSDVLITYVKERLANMDSIDKHRIFVTHTFVDDDQSIPQSVVQFIKENYDFEEVLETTAGCSVSVHCGPKTLGILFVRK